ncbi:MAG: hypothetical protein LIO92_03180 [Clostridiales bacterium]|nr:hypothetical protein [Clostridiales bacterium]
MKEWKIRKEYLSSAVCVAGSIVLYLLLTWVASGSGSINEAGVIGRGDYGSTASEYQLKVEGLSEEEVPITVTVNPRVYTQEEAQQAFAEIMETMEERILGENDSLMEVQSDLKLVTGIAERGIKVRWYSSDTGIMDSSGKLLKEVKEETGLILSAELLAEIGGEGLSDTDADNRAGKKQYQEYYEIPIRVIPPEKTAEEQRLSDFLSAVSAQEEEQRTHETFQLPTDYEGHILRYSASEGDDYRAILLIGVLAAVLLAVREQSQEKERRKKREKELSLDYSDMLSKFVVLSGAGLTARNVWERIVRDYEEARADGRQEQRAVYEEMGQACRQMRNGVSEQEAYRAFGRRCGLPCYLKFCSLLEQNCRSGTKNLREILQMEMTDALEGRKNLARRLGEEAGTKLLVPLFLMLGIVMVMIMVPAMMAMG